MHASYVCKADTNGKTIGVHSSSLGNPRGFHAASSTLLMSAFRETREGVSAMFASVGTQSKRARTPREHSASLTEFAILAMSSLSAYPCTQADKAEQNETFQSSLCRIVLPRPAPHASPLIAVSLDPRRCIRDVCIRRHPVE